MQAEILELVNELRRERRLTVIFVSHDLAVVSRVCDHVIVLRGGALVEQGPTRRVLRKPSHAYTSSLVQNHLAYGVERFSVGPAGEQPASLVESKQAGAPLLSVRALNVTYGHKTILNQVDLDVEPGQIVGPHRRDGIGKDNDPSLNPRPCAAQGRVPFGSTGKDIGTLRGKALRDFRRANRMQYVFQDSLRSLDPDLTIGQSIGEGLDIRGGVDARDRAEKVAAALRTVGLEEALSAQLPRHLSGGQRQRAAIARALVMEPLMLLLG